jgi:UDP-N-acetylglucosamine--N-acetylmuramyl-(pentapeptide) pyrophosphoryl-undecaprenol N-acetylglucosamine transferase
MNVVVAGGGTGGHVFPALAVAAALRDTHGASVTFVGGRDGQEARLVPAAGFPFVGLEVAAAQTRASFAMVRAGWLAWRGSRACRSLVERAAVAVSIGGFASAPVSLAARSAHTPLMLIEQNSVPGLVNRMAARWAVAAATTFETTASRLPSSLRIERTGNPIRPEIAAIPADRHRLRAEACGAFDLDPDRKTVFITGGSQGARHVDQVLAESLPLMAERSDLQLLVSTGPSNHAIVRDAIDPSSALLVRAFGFIDRMELAIAIADVAVARAGASVAELAAGALPMILIPYPHATENHQDGNARELLAAGAARVQRDADLSPVVLASGILSLVDDRSACEAMARAAAAWARPDAAARIAELVVEAAGERA